jgi:hypothetical protein
MEQTMPVTRKNLSSDVTSHDAENILRNFSEHTEKLVGVFPVIEAQKPGEALTLLHRLKTTVPQLQQLASISDMASCKDIERRVDRACRHITKGLYPSNEIATQDPEFVKSAMELASSLLQLHKQICSKVLSHQD